MIRLDGAPVLNFSMPVMPTEARSRAQRCRMRAEECLQLADNATDPAVKKQYEQIAENYLVVAKAEDSLAERLENLGPIQAGLQGGSDLV